MLLLKISGCFVYNSHSVQRSRKRVLYQQCLNAMSLVGQVNVAENFVPVGKMDYLQANMSSLLVDLATGQSHPFYINENPLTKIKYRTKKKVEQG